jgi:flagellar basal-body rod protein FlgG
VERGLFIAASGMLADQLRQDVIANNLANATTPGFKGDRAMGRAFPAMLLDQIGAGSPTQVGALGLGTRIDGVVTDASQGAMRNTGNDFDLAIGGDGWFSVQTGQGVRYTRDGAFALDGQNRLVTATGDPVLGTNGQAVTIPAGVKATIDAQGTVVAGGRTVATLQVATLDPATLRKQGNDLYLGSVTTNGTRGLVHQGYLEQSNVSSVREMVDLITTMRSFEASQKASQALDQTLGKAVNEIGKL